MRINVGSFARKTVLITGANQGLGFETALALAIKDYKVIMVDKSDLTESKQKISCMANHACIVTKIVDFTSLQSVRTLAEDVKNSEEHLDVLFNNVGVFCSGKSRTCDGLQATMQVNHFGPFLLTHLLMELLKKSSPSRILFTSSIGAFFSNLTPANINNPDVAPLDSLSSLIVYYNSKLCNIITSNILAEKLSACNVTCNCFHPGMTGTDFMLKNLPKLTCIPKNLLQSPEKGAACGIFLATSKAVEQTTGTFFVDFKPHQQPLITTDVNFCKEIWDVSEFYTELKTDEKL